MSKPNSRGWETKNSHRNSSYYHNNPYAYLGNDNEYGGYQNAQGSPGGFQTVENSHRHRQYNERQNSPRHNSPNVQHAKESDLSPNQQQKKSEILAEKEKYLQMNIAQKREQYACKTYKQLLDVPVWNDYYKDHRDIQKADVKSRYSADALLNHSVSLWLGDISTLEVDVIVNSTNPDMDGYGGVDKAIRSGAGRWMREECTLHKISAKRSVNFGEAIITGGYKLPAKHVIHTVAPLGSNDPKAWNMTLIQCYNNCMELVKQHRLSTVAFPFIAAGTKAGKGDDESFLANAADIAMSVVRDHMLQNEQIRLVTFCVFSESDLRIYERAMKEYFPVELTGSDSGAGVENGSSVGVGGREHLNSPTYVRSENTSDASQPRSPHDRHTSNNRTPDYLSRGGGFGRGRGTSVSPEIEMGYSGEEERPGQYERPLMSVEHCWDKSTPSTSSRSSHTPSTSQSSGSPMSTSLLSSSASPSSATSATASTDHSDQRSSENVSTEIKSEQDRNRDGYDRKWREQQDNNQGSQGGQSSQWQGHNRFFFSEVPGFLSDSGYGVSSTGAEMMDGGSMGKSSTGGGLGAGSTGGSRGTGSSGGGSMGGGSNGRSNGAGSTGGGSNGGGSTGGGYDHPGRSDSDSYTVEENRDRFIAMDCLEKRKKYKCGSRFTTLHQVETWHDYYRSKQLIAKNTTPSNFPPSEELNKRVSIWKGDITTLEIDAIVNAANSALLGGGGVDGAIHSAAGRLLYQECKGLNGCQTGEAKLTAGYLLPAMYILHTVGPMRQDKQQLQNCYENCLRQLLQQNLTTVAFPCISTGIYGYPNRAAAEVALTAVRKALLKHPEIKRVIFCLFLPTDVNIYEDLMQTYFPVGTQNEGGKQDDGGKSEQGGAESGGAKSGSNPEETRSLDGDRKSDVEMKSSDGAEISGNTRGEGQTEKGGGQTDSGEGQTGKGNKSANKRRIKTGRHRPNPHVY